MDSQKNKTGFFRAGISYMRHHVATLAIACACVGLTLLAFSVAWHREQERICADLDHEGGVRALVLEREIGHHETILRSLTELLASSHAVTREEFGAFPKCAHMRRHKTATYVWIPRVPDAQRAAYEDGVRGEGFPGFQIVERDSRGKRVRAPRREEYFPIHFIEPFDGNEPALGLDLASDPEQLDYLKRARDKGALAVSPPIKLVREAGGQLGFLMILPLYGGPEPGNSVEGRRESLRGFVMGVETIKGFVDHTFEDLRPGGVDVHVFDASAPKGRRFLYYHPTRERRTPGVAIKDETALRAGLHFEATVDLAGRHWVIVGIPTASFIAARRTWLPWGVLGAGLLFTALLEGYSATLRGRAVAARRFAAAQSESKRSLERALDEQNRAKEAMHEARDYLESLVNYANAPIVVWNPQLKITRFNHAFERLTGYASDEVMGRELSMLFPEDNREDSMRQIKRTLRGEYWKSVEIPILPKNGEVRWALWNSANISTKDGTAVVATIAQGVDITERKRAEEAARAVQEQLLEQQRREKDHVAVELARIREELVRKTRLATVGQVSASIAHELRNPLGAVRNAVYYLKRRVPEDKPEFTEYLDIIDEETNAEDRIINNMMAMTRAREPVKETVDLGRIAKEVFGRAGLPKEIHWRVLLEPDPFVLDADWGQLGQVLTNLLANAVQAMEGRGQVLLSARRCDDYDTIVFQDDGPGIARDMCNRVFEPLVSTKAKGTGLGLTICRQIVENHAGTIESVGHEGTIKSIGHEGYGAAFRIRLPRAPLCETVKTGEQNHV